MTCAGCKRSGVGLETMPCCSNGVCVDFCLHDALLGEEDVTWGSPPTHCPACGRQIRVTLDEAKELCVRLADEVHGFGVVEGAPGFTIERYVLYTEAGTPTTHVYDDQIQAVSLAQRKGLVVKRQVFMLVSEEAVVAPKPAIHILDGGQPLCGFTNMSPMSWPAGHKWTDRQGASDATCDGCIAARRS